MNHIIISLSATCLFQFAWVIANLYMNMYYIIWFKFVVLLNESSCYPCIGNNIVYPVDNSNAQCLTLASCHETSMTLHANWCVPFTFRLNPSFNHKKINKIKVKKKENPHPLRVLKYQKRRRKKKRCNQTVNTCAIGHQSFRKYLWSLKIPKQGIIIHVPSISQCITYQIKVTEAKDSSRSRMWIVQDNKQRHITYALWQCPCIKPVWIGSFRWQFIDRRYSSFNQWLLQEFF